MFFGDTPFSASSSRAAASVPKNIGKMLFFPGLLSAKALTASQPVLPAPIMIIRFSIVSGLPFRRRLFSAAMAENSFYITVFEFLSFYDTVVSLFRLRPLRRHRLC